MKSMEFAVQIHDELANRIGGSGGDLSLLALEALALEEFKSGRSNKPSCGGCPVWSQVPPRRVPEIPWPYED
jgi:hypothetical protein